MTHIKTLTFKSIFLGMALMLSSCVNTISSTEPTTEQPVTPVEETEVSKPKTGHILGIIGGVEPVYILPMKSPFLARVDTGATTTSIDITSQTLFERDGQKWVSFTIKNSETGEEKKFQKPVEEIISIKRIGGDETRTVVIMDIEIGGHKITDRVTLAKREKFQYQVLLGRNILNGRAIVDPILSNTLK